MSLNFWIFRTWRARRRCTTRSRTATKPSSASCWISPASTCRSGTSPDFRPSLRRWRSGTTWLQGGFFRYYLKLKPENCQGNIVVGVYNCYQNKSTFIRLFFSTCTKQVLFENWIACLKFYNLRYPLPKIFKKLKDFPLLCICFGQNPQNIYNILASDRAVGGRAVRYPRPELLAHGHPQGRPRERPLPPFHPRQRSLQVSFQSYFFPLVVT